jgi:RNA-directed DNA polymerase
MAAIYLELLDRRMEATGLTYARFMDDWVILAPTRWALRRAVVVVNETLRELRVEQHPGRDGCRACNMGCISRTCRSAL